jgi:hypothetical protein
VLEGRFGTRKQTLALAKMDYTGRAQPVLAALAVKCGILSKTCAHAHQVKIGMEIFVSLAPMVNIGILP